MLIILFNNVVFNTALFLFCFYYKVLQTRRNPVVSLSNVFYFIYIMHWQTVACMPSWMKVFLYIHLFIYLFINLLIYLFIYLFTYLLIYLFIYLYIYLLYNWKSALS